MKEESLSEERLWRRNK